MKERLSRSEMFIEIAALVATRSTCNRASVGAVVVKDGRIVSMGYNGPPSGMPHCDEGRCDLSSHCIRSVHAEANAIYFAARHGIPVEGATIFCTHSPCRKCSEAIINSGISEVVYEEPYGSGDGVKLLVEANLKVCEFVEGNSIPINGG